MAKKDEPKIETWDGTFAEVSEAEDNVITIDTAEELAGLAKKVNTATEVTVSWNERGSTENKSNTNITNDIVGRVS